MGNQGLISMKTLPAGRLRTYVDKEIHKLNIDRTPLLHLLNVAPKKEVTRMEYNWLTKERRNDWATISSFGGAWASGAAVTGTITVPAAEAWIFAPGDVIKAPADSDINIYINSVNQSTGVITGRTYNNSSTIDFSAGTTGANKLVNITNTFELGSGKGTIKSQQPSSNINYLSIIQDTYGSITTLDHVEYEAGQTEFVEQEQEALINHDFSKEKMMFFGRKHKATTGYMNGQYEQYFSGGLLEAISTNVDTQSALTRAEFDAWIDQAIYYAESPLIFCGATVFKAVNFWLGATVQTTQDETTLGVAVTWYKTNYGNVVKLTPHRELLKNFYSGYAFSVDMKDISYTYLKGLDTHIEVDIQAPDLKQRINEVRSWCGCWIGNEKRHGCLKGVASYS